MVNKGKFLNLKVTALKIKSTANNQDPIKLKMKSEISIKYFKKVNNISKIKNK